MDKNVPGASVGFLSEDDRALYTLRNQYTIVCDLKNKERDTFYMLDTARHMILKTSNWNELVRKAHSLGFTGTTGMRLEKINDPDNKLWWWQPSDYVPPGQTKLSFD